MPMSDPLERWHRIVSTLYSESDSVVEFRQRADAVANAVIKDGDQDE